MLDSARALVPPCDDLCIRGCRWQCRWVHRRGGRREVSIHEAIEQRFARKIHGIFAAFAVEIKFDADPFRGQQFELVMKKYRVAAVTKHGATIMHLSEETMRHGGKSRRSL